MIALARSHPGIPVTLEEFDRDPWLLNVANGTIDLRTGKLRPHNPKDMITKRCPVPYDPDARAPRFEQFEREIYNNEYNFINYMRQRFGHALSGDDSEQEVHILHGEGSNGKNVLLDTLLSIVGDYGCIAEPDLLLAKEGRHPTGVADLCGRRLVVASESDDGRQLAESLVKRLTGDSEIKARFMNKDFFTFPRTFKVFMPTNHAPDVRGLDHAIWRRIRLVPFGVRFEDDPKKDIDPPRVLRADPTLRAALLSELPGILALLVRACLDWQRERMPAPPIVVAATEGYRRDLDSLTDFLDLRCEDFRNQPHVRAKTPVGVLYAAYLAYARDQALDADRILSSRRFGAELTRRGYALEKSNSTCWRLGIRLKVPATGIESPGPDSDTPF
jgi:putative DNA primase/helicase